jgi:DNA repair protein RadC
VSYLIKELPIEERPRERFKKYGVESLSNEELLSILLRTGTSNKSVKELSLDILNKIKLNDLINYDFNTLKSIKGVGEVKAITIISAIEFGKRDLSKRDFVKQIRTGDDVYNLVKDDLEHSLQEKFLVLYLDTKKFVICKKIIFVGTVNSSSITPRDVFREGVKLNSASMILVHNHPAGSVGPSYEDLYLTNEFIKLGRMMGIPVIDHLIIGKNNYYSFRESNGDLFVLEKENNT